MLPGHTDMESMHQQALQLVSSFKPQSPLDLDLSSVHLYAYQGTCHAPRSALQLVGSIKPKICIENV
jgi:hypothetical protein